MHEGEKCFQGSRACSGVVNGGMVSHACELTVGCQVFVCVCVCVCVCVRVCVCVCVCVCECE
jgi:hypothetical protein